MILSNIFNEALINWKVGPSASGFIGSLRDTINHSLWGYLSVCFSSYFFCLDPSRRVYTMTAEKSAFNNVATFLILLSCQIVPLLKENHHFRWTKWNTPKNFDLTSRWPIVGSLGSKLRRENISLFLPSSSRGYWKATFSAMLRFLRISDDFYSCGLIKASNSLRFWYLVTTTWLRWDPNPN